MSETHSSRAKPTLLQLSSSDAHQRWRLLKDKLVANCVVAGGLGIIGAVVLIFFYLLYVVLPLLMSSHAEALNTYDVPDALLGNTVLLSMEEQNEIGVRFTDTGKAIFFAVADGKVIRVDDLAIPVDAQISAYAHGGVAKGVIAYGLSDGRVVVVRQEYKVTYPGGKRLITPEIEYPLGREPIVIDDSGQALRKMAISVGEESSSLFAKTADNRLIFVSLSKSKSLFDDEGGLARSEATLDMPAVDVDFMLIDKDQRNLYLSSPNGELTVVNISDKSAPVIKYKAAVAKQGAQVTSMEFLNGEISVLIGDSSGEIGQWTVIRDKENRFTVQKLRSMKVGNSPIITINSEQRRKGLLVSDASGEIGVYHTTSERELIKEKVANGEAVAVTLSPRANAMLLQARDGKIHSWKIENEHPEVSWSSLWQKVWYESYPEPAYVWQSSAASNDFEPKMSLVPLVFGTVKASFYAMLVAIPLALFGAIYTGYFMAPGIRQYVKPGIEIMGALPTVILGFLAGLWLAPFVEKHLTGIFTLLIATPLLVMVFAYIWQYLPKKIRTSVPDGWDAIVLVPIIIFSSWFAFQISPVIDAVCFNGDLRTWMRTEYGIGYDQRNTLVVGLAMGFAVIPMVFSIAEDAIFSVPKHLTIGSLALGATPWQTLSKVVILTASPGIFSAVMIGLGRAVGETMIVLMATGNTPVMDFSIFQGLRTLSANIAVEMPEAEVNSTHYRVLFLAALVLFAFTFIVNSLAELVRQNLRQKYSSL
ncbi:MAG: ABC transporter permease subunit [Gammaproteobacteria bacterium]